MNIENYPLVSEYEVEIKKFGASILNLPSKYEFIPNRTTPIKIFNYGSGTFATIFKIRDVKLTCDYALRCFLNGGNLQNINRNISISKYLSNINAPFLCKNKVFIEGINIKGEYYPIIVMEWSYGKRLNEYVTSIINNNHKITELQIHLMNLSHSLEDLGIAHGDIQSGNVLVEETNTINLKLVDYDPMFIPALKGEQAVEIGHSSFQHPKRNKTHYDATIDRFSFWLLLTALEALKFDKKLWNKDLQGGFNDEDNFLFKAKDLQNPQGSPLVQRLKSLQQPSVDFYLNHLLSDSSSPNREKISLFGKTNSPAQSFKETTTKTTVATPVKKEVTKTEIEKTNEQVRTKIVSEEIKNESFTITSSPEKAKVYIGSIAPNNFKGETPIQLDLSYQSQKVIITYLNKQKVFYLNRGQLFYNIPLEENKPQGSATHSPINRNAIYQANNGNIEKIGFFDIKFAQPIFLTKEEFERELQKGTLFKDVVLYRGEKKNIRLFQDLWQLYQKYYSIKENKNSSTYTIIIVIIIIIGIIGVLILIMDFISNLRRY